MANNTDNDNKFMSPSRAQRIMDTLKLKNERFDKLFKGLENSTLYDIGINSLVCEILNQRGYRIVNYPTTYFTCEDHWFMVSSLVEKNGEAITTKQKCSQDEYLQRYEQAVEKNTKQVESLLSDTFREHIVTSLEREKIIFVTAKNCTFKLTTPKSKIIEETGYTRVEFSATMFIPTIAALYLDVQSVRGAVSNSKEFCIEILTPAPDDTIYDYVLPEEQNQLIKDMGEVAQAIGSKDRIRIQMTNSFKSVADHNNRSRIKEM